MQFTISAGFTPVMPLHSLSWTIIIASLTGPPASTLPTQLFSVFKYAIYFFNVLKVCLFWLHWVFVAAPRFPLVIVSRAYFVSDSRHAGPVVMVCGFSCLVALGIFLAQGTLDPGIGRRILNHWTTREILNTQFRSCYSPA